MRDVYVRDPVEGYQTPKTDSIATTAAGNCLFAGTSEGALARYECQYGTPNERGIKDIEWISIVTNL
jgi:hypothetical protein